MFKWLDKLLSPKTAKETQAPPFRNPTHATNVSEPVISIVKTFDEKRRWKIKPLFDTQKPIPYKSYLTWEALDTVTQEKHTIYSRGTYWLGLDKVRRLYILAPQGTVEYSLPSWMTEAEKKYVCQAIEKRMEAVNERFEVIKDRQRIGAEKQAQINQQKERERLMKLYVGGEK